MDKYIRVAEQDNILFGNLIHQARGNLALNKFAVKCGYTARVFAGYVRGEKTQVRTEKSLHTIIDPIVENAAPDSGVTEEKMFAAMGYLPRDYIKAAYTHYLKMIYGEKHSEIGYDYQTLYNSIDNEMTEKEREDEAFIEYLEDISFFAATLPDSYICKIKKRLYKIYESATVKKMLHDFHNNAVLSYQNTLSEFVEYLKNDDIKKIPQKDKTLLRIHAVLKDLLSDF